MEEISIHNQLINRITKASIDDLDEFLLNEVRTTDLSDSRREEVALEVKIRFEELGIKLPIKKIRALTRRCKEFVDGSAEARELMNEGGKYFNPSIVISRWFFEALEVKFPYLGNMSKTKKAQLLTGMGLKRCKGVYLDGLTVIPGVNPAE